MNNLAVLLSTLVHLAMFSTTVTVHTRFAKRANGDFYVANIRILECRYMYVKRLHKAYRYEQSQKIELIKERIKT